MEKRRHWGHSPLSRRQTQAANGNSSTKASTQRKKFSVMGGTRSYTSRPTTALPAHSSGGRVNNKTVMGVMRVR